MQPTHAGAFVLAGGRSLISSDVAFAGGSPELRHLAPIVPDLHPDRGPLGGVVAALAQTPHHWNIFLAVDVPFVPLALWHTLLAAIPTPPHPAPIAIVPITAGQAHPLTAIYSRLALPGLSRELEAGHLKLISALDSAGPVLYIDCANRDWFRNLNTPTDLAQAQNPPRANQP
jgi:molybdopterin-guanine dinucleotide biosynthesis protein A